MNADQHAWNEAVEQEVADGKLTRDQADQAEYHDDRCHACATITAALTHYQRSERWAG